MVQETSISGQISKIISEKGTELLRVSSIPENLWPEAIQHAVWLKNRTPARALRKKDAKTPYEALKGNKPTLTRERIWGSRAYVTYPPEFRDRADMTKLHSPRGWLGYFVGCESEAMYHIYSPEKHKVYRIGAARVEDGEGLDDPHDTPCLEDRLPTLDVEASDHPISEDEDDTSVCEMSDETYNSDSLPLPAETMARNEPNLPSNRTSCSQSEEEEVDGDDESDEEATGSAIISKYFDQSRHAGMAKREIADDTSVAPKKSRQATHDLVDNDKESSISDISDINDDSWYYSDDGKVSQAYLEFVSKYGNRQARTYYRDDDRCDRCYQSEKICDAALNGMPCSNCVRWKKKCAPQSSKTKRLVLPENRSRSKPISHPKLDKPCRVCFQSDRNCYIAPGGSKCDRCKSKNVTCNWNLEGAKKSNARQKQKDARKLATQGKLGFIPVPQDQKCYLMYPEKYSMRWRTPVRQMQHHTTSSFMSATRKRRTAFVYLVQTEEWKGLRPRPAL